METWNSPSIIFFFFKFLFFKSTVKLINSLITSHNYHCVCVYIPHYIVGIFRSTLLAVLNTIENC